MTNYESWLVGHVSYRLIGLHNVVQLLFSVHINQVFFAQVAEMVKGDRGILGFPEINIVVYTNVSMLPTDCTYLVKAEQSTHHDS